MSKNNQLKNNAKSLRRNATEAEKKLWLHLRAKQMEGIKFRRQQPIEAYIVDFVSFERRVIIELDGGQHATEPAQDKDIDRDLCLKCNGFKVLRFWNNDVMENLEGVLAVIRKVCLR